MARARRNHDREIRIHEEIIVDAYGPEEQAMSWYYYLEDKLQFPLHAQCVASVPTSPLREGDTIEIRKMAPEDSCTSDMLVMTRWKNRNIAVPLSQLKAIDVDESTTQAIEDWHYWIAQGYCF
ncbi:MAG TPA: calcium-binding protein [Terracidiphilus sp.]|nr:calcium-binding protein [Acidobacteriaceae bacterium]HUX43486.1 calcium-binding protein [Terracidiphilus sp.]